MSEIDIEEAIARVKAGSVDDFRTVVVAFHPRLRPIVAGLCPPGVEEDEISHRAFLEAYRRIDQYEADTCFFAWLTAIARNLVRAELEKVRRRDHNEQNYLDHLLAQQLDRAAEEESPALAARSRLLSECMGLLKTDAQSLLAWRYREGLRVQDIAARLSRSASAISVQLFGLRKALRDCVRRKLAHNPGQLASDFEHGSS